MSIPRTVSKCDSCKNNDGEYESMKCMECYHNPWMKDHYEKGTESD